MPELPEVETIRRSLEPKLVGNAILKAEILLPKIIKAPAPADFACLIAGSRIEDLDRRGKYLLLRTDRGYTIVLHLRMTGRLVYTEPLAPLAKHTHVSFHLGDGYHLRFQDQRQFGTVHLLPTGQLQQLAGLAGLGSEPLSDELTFPVFQAMLQGKRRKIKQLLLDQTFLAGIGNIYADEILHQAGLHPELAASALEHAEVQRLHSAIKTVLNSGIEHRGTTVRDYVDGSGQSGDFQHYLQVYQRNGQLCHRCASPIQRIKVAGRSSFFCPYCQPNADLAQQEE